jgi:Uma2 family endonuclease
MAGLVPRYTADEVRTFDDPRLRFEVIRGELFVTPSPGTRHQRAVGELFAALREYVTRHELGEAIVAPFDVEFADDTAVQPDVLVVLHDRAEHLDAERLYGAPSLAVEVVSYSSKRTDRIQKRQLYVEDGVEEYWIVDPTLRRVERWIPAGDHPELLAELLTWQPQAEVPALEIDLKAFFETLDRGLRKA